ncbi:MAG TPA: hypothetical protein VJ860_18005 [Polyangia bacterium]|jgi:hypothetical protein|nr:hypothetical protein [Polyangia bacterium]
MADTNSDEITTFRGASGEVVRGFVSFATLLTLLPVAGLMVILGIVSALAMKAMSSSAPVAGSVWDVAFLDRFVGKLKQITPRVTGFPVTHQVYSRLVVRGFRQAMVYALLAVVVLLALDFRRVDAVLLALLPLGLGFLLLQLLVWIANVRYNYANIAAFPVLMGYGVSFFVNVV